MKTLNNSPCEWYFLYIYILISELQFWNSRLKNLQHIYDQLKEAKVRSMAVILEKTNSAYYNSYQSLFKNTVMELAVAKDLCLYLSPLKKHIQALEQTDFSECIPLLPPIVHVVCLIWVQCKSFDQIKLIILLKQICNLLIQEVRNKSLFMTVVQISISFFLATHIHFLART